MKKITEQELLESVSRLKQYMGEADVGGLDPQQMAQNTLQPGMNPGTPNPWPEGSPQAQAWAKLSPQVQKKIGKADPTDPIIVSRMTKGEFGGLFGGGVTDANPDGTATADTLSKVSADKVAQANTADMAQLKTLVDKLKAMSGSAAGQAGQATPSMYSLSPKAGGIGLKESFTNMLNVLTLLEAEVGPNMGQVNKGGAEPAAAAPAANPEKDALIKQIQDLMAKINSNNENPPPELATALSDAQAAIDAASKAAADPAKPADPQAAQKKPVVPAKPDPKVLALQQELIKKGAKIKADGVMGPLTQAAQKQFGGQAGQKTAPAQAGVPPELAAIPNPKPGQEMWVKGTRYEYTGGQQTRAGKLPGTWKPTFQKGDWGWNTNQAKAQTAFSSPELANQPQAAQKKTPAAPAVPAKESVSYGEDQSLARIIQLSR